jgi:hypothetical protein
MLLNIGGKEREFFPIREFRALFGLSPSFGVSLFQTKDYPVTGSIKNAGEELRSLHRALVDAIPDHMPASGWSSLSVTLQILFRNLLDEINPSVGLKRSEMDFAVNGLGQLCHMLMYACVQARMRGERLPSADAVYQRWLNTTVMVLPEVYPYIHQGHSWRIRVVQYAYGRVGLIVVTDAGAVFYVHDNELSCPAEHFMGTLLRDVAARIIEAMEQSLREQETAYAGGRW